MVILPNLSLHFTILQESCPRTTKGKLPSRKRYAQTSSVVDFFMELQMEMTAIFSSSFKNSEQLGRTYTALGPTTTAIVAEWSSKAWLNCKTDPFDFQSLQRQRMPLRSRTKFNHFSAALDLNEHCTLFVSPSRAIVGSDSY